MAIGGLRRLELWARLGYAARGFVYLLLGWVALRAALDGERVGNSGDALALLRADHNWLFLAVAAGLAVFGLVSLMMARYRRIEDRDVVDDLGRGFEKGVKKAAASVKS